MTVSTRHILIGLIDGLTIPFAIASGLVGAGLPNHTIFVSAMAVTTACAIMMAISGYLSSARPSPALPAALTIGISYAAGGWCSLLPFLCTETPFQALKYAAAITLPALLLSGYHDSRINNASGPAGAARVMITAAVAALAAFGVARLFR